MSKKNTIIPPHTSNTDEPSIPTTRPPGPEAKRFAIPATPPACAEAREIAKRPTVERQIEDNTPSWRNVFQSIFGE